MDNINIAESDFGPEVHLDVSGIIKISGKSMMEDAETFYAAIHEWVKDFILSTNSKLLIEMNLKYFNSSSAKQLLKMLMAIDDVEELDASVNWKYPSNNDILLERGEELAVMVDLQFNYLPF